MAIPEWMKPQWEAIKASTEIWRRLGGKRKRTIGFAKPVGMGGTGEVIEQGEIRGRDVSVELTRGVETKVRGRARIVQTADGETRVIAGGHEQPVTVFDAGRILGRLGREARAAVARDRKRRKDQLKKS